MLCLRPVGRGFAQAGRCKLSLRNPVYGGPAAFFNGLLMIHPTKRRLPNAMHAVALARPNFPANRPNPIVQTRMTFRRNFADASLRGINLILCPIRQGGQVGHHDIRPSHQTQLPSTLTVDGRQSGGAGNVRLRANDAGQGNHLIGHLLGVRNLPFFRDRALPIPVPERRPRMGKIGSYAYHVQVKFAKKIDVLRETGIGLTGDADHHSASRFVAHFF